MDCITVEVIRDQNEPWGIQLSGEAPCYINDVKQGSPAEEAGIQKGDCIFSVNGVSAYDATQEQVVLLIAESGRMIRFKLLPNLDSDQVSLVPSSAQEETFWTNEDPSALNNSKSKATKSTFDEDDTKTETFDYTNYEKYCEQIESGSSSKPAKKHEENSSDVVRKEKRRKKKKKKVPKTEIIDQSKFVVTREDQREFDLNHVQECTFQGGKASVAGAFTGDHNQIVGNAHDDVRGIRARVIAGIQHFSFEDEQDKINPADRGKIIVYTTGLGIHRSVAQSCEEVRKILRGYRVKFEDRDIFTSSEHKEELYQRLGLEQGAPFPEMPRVYIDGVYVGGFNEVQAMSDCGDLRIRLKEFPKYNIRSKCPTCSSSGQVVCHSCNGKAFRKKNRFALLKCGTCNQKGQLVCPDCL